MGEVSVDVGHWSSDYNDNNGIKRSLNTLSSLFFRTNYMKLYDNKYYKLANSIELFDGFVFKQNVAFSNRTALTNNSQFSFFYTNKAYSTNLPVNNYVDTINTGDYKALNAEFGFEYTPHMHYIYGANKRKMYAGSTYPTFSLNVKKGIPSVFDSKSDFLFVSGGISQRFKWGIASKFEYSITAGGFPVNKNVHFADFYHVSTQKIPVLINTSYNSYFSLLDYYKASNNERFIESHVNLTLSYMALKFLPLLNLTNLRENVTLGLLSTPSTKQYVELGYGLTNMPMGGSLSYVAGFDQKGFVLQGVKVTFNFTNTIVIGGE